MQLRNRLLGLATAAGLVVLGGCHEYHVEVTLNGDGSGTRIIDLHTDQDLSPETRWLLAIVGDDWTMSATTDLEGNQNWRYRTVHEIADRDGWREAGGTVLRADPDGEIQLASAIEVANVNDAEGRRLVYRETLSWTGLTARVADIVADDYARFLRREYPDLPDSLVHESRGAMAATVTMDWAELTTADAGEQPEADLEGRFNELLGRRLTRAGVAPDLVRQITDGTADWDAFDGVKDVLPGLDHCFRSTLFLTVIMPRPVTGGDADLVEGNTAKFRVELSSTLPGPRTLEVSCGR